MRRALLALLLLGAVLAPGCFEPFRVHVEGRLWREAGWQEDRTGVRGGFFEGKQSYIRYNLTRENTAPPFPGSLEVISLRGLGRIDAGELRRVVEREVERGLQDKHIEVTGDVVTGKRTLESGVRTEWSLRTGRTTQPGTLFNAEVTVRVLAEVGHDGRSDTTFVAIAYVQVERAQQCPLLVPCQPTRSLATWIQVVGDAEGSIDGATSATGFIDNLVTH